MENIRHIQLSREEALVVPTRERSYRNASRAGGDGGFAIVVVDEIGSKVSTAVDADISLLDTIGILGTQDWYPLYQVLSSDIIGYELIASVLDTDLVGDNAKKQTVIDRFVERSRITLSFLRAKAQNEELFEEYTLNLKKKGAKWASRDSQQRFIEATNTDLTVVEQDLLRRLGLFVLDVAKRLGVIKETSNKGFYHLSLTRPWRRRCMKALRRKALSRPIRRPMLCQPLDWNNAGVGGGYLSKWMRYPLVKGDSLASPMTVLACNNMQRVAFTINQEVYELASIAVQQYASRLGDYTDTKLHKAVADLDEAKVLLGKKFWYCVKVDGRGRCYYVSDPLNPQGWDLSKGLLMYAEGSPRTVETERELFIHTANCFGNNKSSYDDRYQWVCDNLDAMTDDPMGFWKANDPGDKSRYQAWAAMKTCTSDSMFIHINCSSDATQSGMQHLSVMAGDTEIARSTNILPHPEGRQDLYGDVAEPIDGRGRNDVKRPVMCIPYGISKKGMVNSLLEEGICSTRPEAITLADEIWTSCEGFMGSIMTVMKFLKSAGRRLAEVGVRPSWTIPATGFRVILPYARDTHRITVLNAKGDLIKCQMGLGTLSQVDVNQIVSGMAPNFVHSYDAALVHLVCSRWTNPIWVVHDCFGTLPHLVAALKALIHDCFIELYGVDAVMHARHEFFAQGNGKVSIPMAPVRRPFDLEATRDAEYAYS
mgnify:CR=1 FL=1